MDMLHAYDNTRDAQIRTVRQMVAAGDTMHNIVGNAHWFLDLTLNQLGDVTEGMDCKEGCFFCCTLSPDTIPQEIDYVLGEHIPPERLKTNAPICPLLHLGKCTVYKRRPIMCRTWHSLDVERCKLAYDTQDGSVTIPAIGIVTVIGGAVLEGLTEGIRQSTFKEPKSLKLWEVVS